MFYSFTVAFILFGLLALYFLRYYHFLYMSLSFLMLVTMVPVPIMVVDKLKTEPVNDADDDSLLLDLDSSTCWISTSLCSNDDLSVRSSLVPKELLCFPILMLQYFSYIQSFRNVGVALRRYAEVEVFVGSNLEDCDIWTQFGKDLIDFGNDFISSDFANMIFVHWLFYCLTFINCKLWLHVGWCSTGDWDIRWK